jgi:hypothetical protein
VLAGLAAVSLFAVVQMTSRISRASTPFQVANAVDMVTDSGLKPAEQIAVSTALGWQDWVPQAYQIWWTEPEFFTPASQPPPASAAVVEVPWLAGQSEQASWPQAPHGWHIVAADESAGWVAWRAP